MAFYPRRKGGSTLIKRFIAFMLCLVMLAGCSLPAQADTAKLYAALSGWFQDVPRVHFTATLQVNALQPFTDTTVSLLNGFLKHVTVLADLQTSGEDSQTDAQIALDAQTAADWLEREQNGTYTFTTSLLPKRTLTSTQTSPANLLASDGGQDVQSAAEAGADQAFSCLDAITQLQQCYQALTDGIQPYATEKKANYSIKNIGKGVWSRVARLTKEQCDGLLSQLCAVLACGMDDAYRAQLAKMTFEKGLTVALYRDADEKDICVYIKGNAVDAHGNRCKLTFQWAFTTNGQERTDVYRFGLSKAAGTADMRSISASCTQKNTSDVLGINCTTQTTLKQGKTKDDDLLAIDLKGKKNQAAELTCAGSVSQTRTQTGDDDASVGTQTLAVDLRLTPDDTGAMLSGTIVATRAQNQTTQSELSWTLAAPAALATAATATAAPATAAPATQTQRTDGITVNILPSAQPEGTTAPEATEAVPDSSLTLYQQTSATAVPSATPTAKPTAKPQQSGGEYLVGATPVGVSAYPTPAAETVINLDTANTDTLNALLSEAAQNLAGKLLTAVAALPEADRALLKDGMTDTDYAAFQVLLGEL
jgi:hypothetical protein